MDYKYDSALNRAIRASIADPQYSEADIERGVEIFKKQQEQSLILRQYGKPKKESK